jgi:superkiller protein 3
MKNTLWIIFLILLFSLNIFSIDIDKTIALASFYDDNNEFDRALENYFKVLEFNPNDAKVLNSIGYVYIKIGEFDKAIEFFKKAIKFSPDYTIAYNNLATAYYRKGLLDNAIKTYKIAIQLNPKYVKALANLAVCYYHKKDYLLAAEYFIKAKLCDEKYVKSRFYKKEIVNSVKEEIEKNPNRTQIYSTILAIYSTPRR